MNDLCCLYSTIGKEKSPEECEDGICYSQAAVNYQVEAEVIWISGVAGTSPNTEVAEPEILFDSIQFSFNY